MDELTIEKHEGLKKIYKSTLEELRRKRMIISMLVSSEIVSQGQLDLLEKIVAPLDQ